ncbi:hypothetical protein ACFYU8_18240 [Brevibacillus sp. NPDC003359]|uniref:hypothetical protein n=1 Tax=unclassified Brevibacillus TaxID=2684853 RepID=UPI0036B562D6
MNMEENIENVSSYMGVEWSGVYCLLFVIVLIHTIELLPFHSDRWKAGMISQEEWFRNLPSTQLAIDVIEEIACSRLVKHILGIGLPWADILGSFPDKFYLDAHCLLTGTKGRIGHRIFKFMPVKNPEGQSIVIYSGSSMNLPVNKHEAVNTISGMLGLTES